MATDTTFVNSPSETVKAKFKASGGLLSGGDTSTPPIPDINTADLAQKPLPQQTPSPTDIESFYKPLLDQIQNQQQPLSRPVPADVSPSGTFLGLLAGNLASTFSRNPAFADQAHEYLAEQHRTQQAIQNQNYATQLAFDAEKRNNIIAVRGQILEKTLDEAIKSGDLQRANVASQNLAKFQEGLQRESQRQKAQQEQALEKTKGAEARKLEAQKAALSLSLETKAQKEAAKAAAKPMSTKDYLQGINDINKNKNILSEGKGFFFGMGPRTDTTPTSHESALEQFHASAILNGEPTVKASAKQNLKRLILTRLGLIGKTPDAAAKAKVKDALGQYGLTPADVL